MNLTSGPPPYAPSAGTSSTSSAPYGTTVADLGALNYMPCKDAEYIPLTLEFFSYYVSFLSELSDVDIGKRCECYALFKIALEELHTITQPEWYQLNTLVDRLPQSLLMRGVHYGDDYRRMLLQFYQYVYSVEPVSPNCWRRYANEVDSSATDLYPEERVNITCLLDEHTIEIENSVYREAGQLRSVRMNPMRINYVSFKNLREEAIAVEKLDFSKSRETRRFLCHKIEKAKELAALTAVQQADLLSMFRII